MDSFGLATRFIIINDKPALQKLIDKNPEILELTNDSGWSLLHNAIKEENIDIADFLIQKGVDINSVNNSYKTPLHFAVLPMCKNYDLTKFLIDKGADLNVRDEFGKSPLHYAVVYNNGDTNIVELLIDSGTDVNITDYQGNTPLHYATGGSSDRAIVKLLTKNGADINAKNYKGQTLLHHVTMKSNVKTMKLLILQGADPCIKDDNDKTPLDYLKDIRIRNELLFIYANREKISKEIKNHTKD